MAAGLARLVQSAAAVLGVIVAFQQPTAAQLGAVQGVDAHVSSPPQCAVIDGRPQIYYELRLISFASAAIQLTSINVEGADVPGSVLKLIGPALAQRVGRPGAVPGDTPLTMAPGATVTLYLEVPVKSCHQTGLGHRITFDTHVRGGQVAGAITIGVPRPSAVPLPAIGPPLAEGTWAALYDPSMDRGHRRVFYAVDGLAKLPGRFAIDYFGVANDGATYLGQGDLASDYFGYGSPVLAVADATAVFVRDNVPGPVQLSDHPDQTAIGDGTGNYIVLDLGRGRYAFYEHLRRGIPIKTGARVRRGQVIGALGMTGSALTPHLHFHVADSIMPLASEGLSYRMTDAQVQGAFRKITDFGQGPWAAASSRPVDGMPAPNMVVRFPQNLGLAITNGAPNR